VLGIKPKAMFMLGKHFTTKLTSQLYANYLGLLFIFVDIIKFIQEKKRKIDHECHRKVQASELGNLLPKSELKDLKKKKTQKKTVSTTTWLLSLNSLPKQRLKWKGIQEVFLLTSLLF
jgi:hypothetical protein